MKNELTEEEWESLREQLDQADREDSWLFHYQLTAIQSEDLLGEDIVLASGTPVSEEPNRHTRRRLTAGSSRAFVEMIARYTFRSTTNLKHPSQGIWGSKDKLEVQIDAGSDGAYTATLSAPMPVYWLLLVAPNEGEVYVPDAFQTAQGSVRARHWGGAFVPGSIHLGPCTNGTLVALVTEQKFLPRQGCTLAELEQILSEKASDIIIIKRTFGEAQDTGQ